MDRRMDIISLLSPQDSPSGKSTPAAASTRAAATASSGSAPTFAPTPSPVSAASASASPHHNYHKSRQNSSRAGMTSSPLVHQILNHTQLRDPSPQDLTQGNGTRTPPSSELQPARKSSTPGIDALADLASMQRPQPHRANPPIRRNASTEIHESQMSPSTLNPTVNPIPRNHSTPRPHFDVSEGLKEANRRDFSNSSLAPNMQQMASELYAHIQQNRHAYESRVKFIRLLHQGFVEHVYPPSSPDSRGDPHTYDVLPDLRAAREELDHLFAIGEDLWAEWIQDESVLARSVDEQVGVMELCRRSVDEEYGSTKLWIIYGEWMLYLYNSASQPGDAPVSRQWSEEDRIVAQKTFTWQSVVDVWMNAAEATNWRINDSHLVWDRYLELVVRDVGKQPSPDKLAHARDLFVNRLQVPHMTWDQTFQLFSNFISTYYNNHYEETMVDMTNRAAHAKALWNAREVREVELRRAAEAGDSGTEWSLFVAYIEWELNQNRRKNQYSFDLICALYQRVVLRFPTDVGFWEDYIMFIVEASMNGGPHSHYIPALPSLERATRHCPWSGTLWSQRILSAERAGRSFTQIADIKHKATRTGLLDTGGINEVIKVHTTWCSYLRRRAFQPDSTDEDLDVAEVGIRSAIESIQELGEKDNKAVPNDPLFRLERIYIRYLSESGSWDSARETFKGLVARHGHSYEFWMMYYTWELLCWSKFTQSDDSASASRRTPNPSLATAVLKQALQRTDLDWPEKIMSTYIDHCEHYEDADELQIAVVGFRKAMKALTKRREEEALQAAAHQSAAAAATTSTGLSADVPAMSAMGTGLEVENETTPQGSKRKRIVEEVDVNGSASKKAKADDDGTPPKRDRENATVIVENLPSGVTETRVRQFFRDCGKINSLKLLSRNGNQPRAIVEFDTREDALAAQTRDQRTFEDQTISVHVGTNTTLFVTNFAPTADEAYVRDLFSPYGEVVDIRFPSLKYNTHRRFCYVQFQTAIAAHAATELNGTQQEVVGDLAGSADSMKLPLVVKISDPTKRQERTGPTEEGREIHVSNLDWKATEDDLVELFAAYGQVEAARIPRKANGASKGFGFVVFQTKESAEASLAMNEQLFRSRPLHVHISTPTVAKRQAATIISRVGAGGRSKSPSMEPNGASPSSSAPHASDQTDSNPSDKHLRTLALMNIPDTVNDTRISAIVSPYGALVKLILRPDHQGAIVEFLDVNDAGRASLGLDGYEIAPGRRIRVGSVGEMLKMPAERRVDRILVGKEREQEKRMKEKEMESDALSVSAPGAAGKSKMVVMKQSAAPIRRPAQPGGGVRSGRRGGLGVKRGGASAAAGVGSGQQHAPAQASPLTAVIAPAKKNNDDFRAMLESSKSRSQGQDGGQAQGQDGREPQQ
ncbi:RNA-binding protein Prp24 [Histoplasma capsulatum G186AR]|uniref:U4/U6 snRNA-associated-splicing factor PRP24 n=1 Tax=Ajellomyces capsulatus TaxID=5037 RepID=A0A8H8CUN0_AJECA|nr:RNA-binding protein Prp24 [Histoplasma capsulatum]QSS72286.1 RNA-binding protein Prp24 [Histoplasma capsulatum G186AR]